MSEVWDAFVDLALAHGAEAERPSRFGDKPALYVARREIAHRESAHVVDVRITAAGWRQVRDQFGDDPAVTRDPARRDWIDVHLDTPADVTRYEALVRACVAANR